MRIPLLLTSTLLLSACGFLSVPMITRLQPDEQKDVDTAWHNMLTPINRVTRDDLLGALTLFQMYQTGIDSAEFRAKQVDDKRVIMEVHFRKDQPEGDAFCVTILDEGGQTLRSERYSPQDMQQLQDDLRNLPANDGRPLIPDEQTRRDRFDNRWLGLHAATQPAGWTPPPETQPAPPPASK